MKRYIYSLYIFVVIGIMFLLSAITIAPAAFAEQKALKRDTVIQTLTIRRIPSSSSDVTPILGQDYTSVDTLKRDSSCLKPLTRAERRKCRVQNMAFKLDSMITLQEFTFYPTTMQAAVNGEIRMIFADYCYMMLSPVDFEVHLPVERGVSQYLYMLSFDTAGVENYTAVKYLSEWRVSWQAKTEDDIYHFDMLVNTITSEVVVLVQSSSMAMRYVGVLGEHQKEKEKEIKDEIEPVNENDVQQSVEQDK